MTRPWQNGGGLVIDILKSSPLFVMRLDVGYARAVHLGAAPGQGRSVFPVDGGSFDGARLRGTVGPGVDWVTWRDDGAMIIDVRLTLTTDDGVNIGMHYGGLAAGEGSILTRFRGGELPPPGELYVRITPRFETADPRYAWLNRTIAVGNGLRTAEGPIYHVFAIE